jgi:O-antigen/teichoic acid export membrane protein
MTQPTTTNPPEQPDQPQVPVLLGRTAARGLSLTLLANVFAKGSALLAQVVLAIFLTKEDFGLYALAISIQMFIQTFRDGGIRDYVVARQDRYRDLIGAAFWMGLTINILLALGLGAAGHLMAALYARGEFGQKALELPLLMWITAVALPLSTFPTVLSIRLRIDLMFGVMARVTVVSSIVRYGSMIALAVGGFGALSFVIPVVIATLAEWVMYAAATSERPWRLPARVRAWGGILRESVWLVLGSSATGITNYGYYLVAAYFISAQTLGVYFFAISLLMQVETLLTAAFQGTMLPVLTRLRDEPRRLGEAGSRLARAIVLTCAPMSLALAAVFPLIDLLIWNGKWAGAALPIAILAAAHPFRCAMASVPHTILQAQARFRDWFFMWFRNGCGLVAAAAAAPFIFGDSAEGLAVCVAVFLAVSSLLSTLLCLRPLGIGARALGLRLIRLVLMAVVASVLTTAAERFAIAPALRQDSAWDRPIRLLTAPSETPDGPTTPAADHGVPSQPLPDASPAPASPAPGPGLMARLAARAMTGLHLALTGLVFASLMFMGTRLLAGREVREILSVLPSRLAAPASRLFP